MLKIDSDSMGYIEWPWQWDWCQQVVSILLFVWTASILYYNFFFGILLKAWEMVNFSIIVGVAVICRPTSNSGMLSYASQLPMEDPGNLLHWCSKLRLFGC